MPPTVRPRRSVLYMPGANGRALEKAQALPADGLIFDLEDAVVPEAKATARQMVCAAVRSGAYGRRERIVRVNGLATPWGHDDLQAVAHCGAGSRERYSLAISNVKNTAGPYESRSCHVARPLL